MDVALTEILALDALAGLSGQITDILPALGFFPLCGMWKRPCFLRLFHVYVHLSRPFLHHYSCLTQMCSNG